MEPTRPVRLMDENLALENLVDFLKYREGDSELDLDQLKFHINFSILNHPDVESYGYLFIAKAMREISPDLGGIDWVSLLSEEAAKHILKIQTEVNEFQFRLIA